MARPQTIQALGWRVTQLQEPLAFTDRPLPISPDNLFALLGFNAKFPWFVVRNSNACYNRFWIDKDTKQVVKKFNPDLRLREINAPNKPLKALQARIVELLSFLPMHKANFAYMKGKNIRMCAEEHLGADVIIKMDLKNFFQSHHAPRIKKKLKEITGWPGDVCGAISAICTLNGSMPQGAVSSPFLSIVLNRELDERIDKLAVEHGFVYTRYADDLAFGGKKKSNQECWAFIKAVQEAIHPYHVNWDKVDVMRNSSYRYLCGVTVSEAALPIVLGRTTGMTVKKRGDVFDVYTREPMPKDLYESLVSELCRNGFTEVKPKYYYMQDIQRILGMNLTGGIKYPRAKFNDMRLQALLVKKRAKDVNPQRFFGRLSFLRSIDPRRASIIDSILRKGAANDSVVQPDRTS